MSIQPALLLLDVHDLALAQCAADPLLSIFLFKAGKAQWGVIA